MIEWFTWVQLAVAVAAGLLCLVLGFAGRVPNDLTTGALALIELLLVVQLVVAIAAPAFGNEPTGSLLEFYIYLVGALLLPPAAVFWAPARAQPLEHGRARRRGPRGRRHGLPHAADLDRAAGLAANERIERHD